MGHYTLKRVPYDFSWPLKTLWKGYYDPYYELAHIPCEPCNLSGFNPATKAIEDDFYLGWSDKLTQNEVKYLVREGRLAGYFGERKGLFLPRKWGKRNAPSAEFVNRCQRDLEFRRRHGIWRGSHDACNRWILSAARAKRLGVYGICEFCNGKGQTINEFYKKKSDEWKDYDPPVGPGWQLWETISEGSPISPIFKSPMKLALWAEKNVKDGMHHSDWLELFLKDDPESAMAVGTLGMIKNGQAGFIQQFKG